MGERQGKAVGDNVLQTMLLYSLQAWDSQLPKVKGCFGFVFQDRVSLCSPGYPGTYSVNQADFRTQEIHLSLPPAS